MVAGIHDAVLDEAYRGTHRVRGLEDDGKAGSNDEGD